MVLRSVIGKDRSLSDTKDNRMSAVGSLDKYTGEPPGWLWKIIHLPVAFLLVHWSELAPHKAVLLRLAFCDEMNMGQPLCNLL
jgi:hypothetical protein